MGHVVNFSKQINKPACWRNPEERRCVGTGVVENAMRNSHRHAHKVAGSGVVKLAIDKQVKFTRKHWECAGITDKDTRSRVIAKIKRECPGILLGTQQGRCTYIEFKRL